jgi:peptidoglycan/LPS O-acetylase OafA/YrhL
VRYDNLQCVRAVAATAVVVAHTPAYATARLGTPPAFNGHHTLMFTSGLAVATFFALSGFVLAHALRSGTLRSFVGFRLLRLYPAFWAAFLLVLAVHLTLGTLFAFGWGEAKYLPKVTAFWRAFFLVPGPGAMYTLGVEWTLVYEVCLSLALAVIAAVVGRRRGLGVVVAVWLGLCLVKQLAEPVGYNWPLLPRAAEWPLSVVNVPFLCGVLAYLMLPHWGGFRRWVPAAAGLALLGAAAVPEAIAGWANALQGLAAALLLGYAATGRQVRSNHVLVKAGDWSYGIYLLHAPVLVVFFALSARHAWLPPTHTVAAVGGGLAFTVAAAFGAVESAVYRKMRAAVLRRTKPPVAKNVSPPPPLARAA